MEEEIQSLIKRFREYEGTIISLLQETQDKFGYIPEEAVNSFSKELNIPASNFYGVTTFYARFHLKPGAVSNASVSSPVAAPLAKDQKQVKLLLSAFGDIDPEAIESYSSQNGYSALQKALTSMTPEEVIDIINKSGLRGRGGSGFPTGVKWEACRHSEGDQKFIICNTDDGDPGAFMDRAVLESNPHSVIESLAIGAYAVGASKGYVYVRSEYALAVQRLEKAVASAREKGYLGTNLFGKGFDFDIRIALGSGSFVCGEETALIEYIEGHRGMARAKPVFPVQRGLWGMPTVVNNIETLANIPHIVNKGHEWFSSYGTEKSKGTKLFSLTGKVRNPGLIEVPMGITLREIIYDIGGGIEAGHELKAVQIGGPLGGCLKPDMLDIKMAYESFEDAGAFMGSGGIIVLAENDCMVEMAKSFLKFTREESCGKCVPCRIGTKRLFEILGRITDGRGKAGDIEIMEKLGNDMKVSSLCGLGQEAPNPVLSTIRHFRDEYESHITARKCPANVCENLVNKEEAVVL